MTSEERRQARYERRQAKRKAKKQVYADCDDFNRVFNYDTLMASVRECKKNVAWKASVQKYVLKAPVMVHRTLRQLQNGTYRSSGFYEFDLNERGKTRHIRSVTIAERVVQKCLCDYSLVPVIDRSFIYDNGATQKNKGYHFSMDRLKIHLQKHYRKYGNEGYILLFDFRKFFDNVDHQLIFDIMDREYKDEKLKALTRHFVECFGDKGLGLGSQISQTFALTSANRLDHFFKEWAGIKGYGRYMDDGYLIHRSKEYLQRCLRWLKALCRRFKITLNEKKTQIVKLSHGFTWLKCRWYLTKTGKVIKKIPKKSVTAQRRKLKKLKAKVEAGEMTYQDVYQSFQSWRAYARHFNAHKTIQEMEKLYNRLFVFPERDTDPIIIMAILPLQVVTPPRNSKSIITATSALRKQGAILMPVHG